MRPNLTCKNPIEVATENNHKKLIVLLVKRAEEEEIERKRAEHARAEAQKRAAEHRRKVGANNATTMRLMKQLLNAPLRSRSANVR